MRNIYDQTLFAWSLSSASIEDVIAQERAHQGAVPEDKLTDPSPFVMFAPHPKAFKGCQNIVYVYGDMPHIGTYVKEKNGSIRATLPIVTLKEDSGMQGLMIGLLPCSATDNDYRRDDYGEMVFEKFISGRVVVGCLIHNTAQDF
jgi:hypothetical protein